MCGRRRVRFVNIAAQVDSRCAFTVKTSHIFLRHAIIFIQDKPTALYSTRGNLLMIFPLSALRVPSVYGCYLLPLAFTKYSRFSSRLFWKEVPEWYDISSTICELVWQMPIAGFCAHFSCLPLVFGMSRKKIPMPFIRHPSHYDPTSNADFCSLVLQLLFPAHE
ncbi:hypothetical protein BO82DRAFT_124346 [Aspergillus uvarum CBS 121591]|uniref:Uncharacterized protein n=1 Tax=Aspergillus uvarum CBS 121591 TaxID=1448315 RepID=A0A319C3Y5_9EURO|nr:hypothetical protein BO82DRAFT_124346 [Aspergillus uvarum CBS 121591]PYH79844.1 hypothetical protein BO82DRAFT_124346 [Aspergillus uvarum CBS 121591]